MNSFILTITRTSCGVICIFLKIKYDSLEQMIGTVHMLVNFIRETLNLVPIKQGDEPN